MKRPRLWLHALVRAGKRIAYYRGDWCYTVHLVRGHVTFTRRPLRRDSAFTHVIIDEWARLP